MCDKYKIKYISSQIIKSREIINFVFIVTLNKCCYIDILKYTISLGLVFFFFFFVVFTCFSLSSDCFGTFYRAQPSQELIEILLSQLSKC